MMVPRIAAFAMLLVLAGCARSRPRGDDDDVGDGDADADADADADVDVDADGDVDVDAGLPAPDAGVDAGLCVDLDGDGRGAGDACMGPDCDDADPAVWEGARCDDPCPDGWEAFDFAAEPAETPCDGERWITCSETYGLVVGVILCSDTRYKILLAETRDDTFYAIGDYAGHGQDHCELVNPDFTIPDEDDITSGGCGACATGNLVNPAGGTGWSRAVFGDPFVFEPVWPQFNLYTSSWYECGVAIP